MNQDLEHLRLLSIFHYFGGTMTALFACIPFIHLFMGILLVSGALDARHVPTAPPAIPGWILIIAAIPIILLGWSLAAVIMFAGRFLARQTRYMYRLVVAAIECLFMPFGTILGVFTIIVLNRDSVKRLFQEGPAV